MAEIGGRLAMTPASYGMFSRRLPPFTSPRYRGRRTAEILLDAFGQLAEHAEAEGVIIALEPLNRYENHMINTLADAASLCEQIGSPHLGIAADTYHMNIEEADPLKALIDAGAVDPARPAQRQQPARARRRPHRLVRHCWRRRLGHRLRPTSWPIECRLSGEADEVLPVVGPPDAASWHGHRPPATTGAPAGLIAISWSAPRSGC